MIFSEIAEQYHDWLYKIVCGEWSLGISHFTAC